LHHNSDVSAVDSTNNRRPIHSVFKIPLIPAGNSSLTLTKGIDPGKTYFISVYSLKGSMSSSQSTVTAVSSMFQVYEYESGNELTVTPGDAF